MSSVAWVAGGAGGIGGGVVEALQRQGASVAVLDLQANPRATLSLSCDLTDEAQVGEAAGVAIDALGVPTQLVCAAGVVDEAPLHELGYAQWQRVVDASLTSVYLLLHRVLAPMADAGGGSVVVVSSGWGHKGYPHGAHYASAKAGVEALTKSVALEYAGAGIRCNAVAPGPVRTPMTARHPNFDESAKAALIPLGRIGEVGDVVAPVMFLLGDGARYITGQVLHVNGGMLMP